MKPLRKIREVVLHVEARDAERAAAASATNAREAGRRRRFLRLLARLGAPRRIRLAFIVGMASCLVVVLAAGSVLLVEWLLARRITVEFLNETVQARMEELERGVRSRLDPVPALLDQLAGLAAAGVFPLDDRPRLESALLTALAGRTEPGGIVYIDPEGGRTVVSRNAGGDLESSHQGPDVPLPARLAEAMAGDSDRVRWGGFIYAPGARQPLLYALRRVSANGVARGHLAAGVTVAKLSALVDELAADGPETPFILLGRDIVLAHPQLVDIGSALWPALTLPTLGQIGDPAMTHLWEGEPLPAFDRSRPEGIDVRWVWDGSESWIVALKPLAGYGDEAWTIGLYIPGSLLTDTLAPLRMGAFLGAGLVVVAMVTAILASRRLVRPLEALTSEAARISSFELETVRPLPRSRVRELDEQAAAFNAMLATIKAFAAYVPRSLVERLIRVGRTDAIRSVERDLTVMFTDIAGFTQSAERLAPARIAALLNEHFALLAACIEAEGGTVDKFMGDGLMAFWGAPEKLKGRATRACRAALAIEAALRAENEGRAVRLLPPVRLRIGLHRGRLIVGNIGAPGRVNYTVVGDVVNVAQRLEQLGKTQMGPSDQAVILVSAGIVEEAGPGFDFEPIGEVSIEGRSEPVRGYRMRSPSPARPDA